MSELDKEIVQADLEAARAEADRVGVSYSPNAKADTIRKKVAAHLAGEDEDSDEDTATTVKAPSPDDKLTYATRPLKEDGTLDIAALPKMPVKRGKTTVMDYTPVAKDIIRKELTRLVRVKITCFNPAKKEWKGEIFSFINPIVGAVKKFVPYNCPAGDSYHIPYCIYTQMKRREYQAFSGKKVNGVEVKEARQVKEFAIEILPPLTKEELDALARKQHKGTLEDED